MNKILAALNFLTVIAIIYWNYYTAAVGFNGNDIGELSDKYGNLFTPAPYAFSIWGLIFLGLIVVTGYMIWSAWNKSSNEVWVSRIGWSLLLANICNGLWTYVWLMEMTGTSVLVMLCILGLLLYTMNTILKTDAHQWLAKVPIGIYTGWISVATIANIAAHLNKDEWHPILGEINWTLAMIVIATVINIYVVRWKGVRSYGAIGVWALMAVSLRHWDLLPIIQWTALVCALFIGLAILRTSLSLSKTT